MMMNGLSLSQLIVFFPVAPVTVHVFDVHLLLDDISEMHSEIKGLTLRQTHTEQTNKPKTNKKQKEINAVQ